VKGLVLTAIAGWAAAHLASAGSGPEGARTSLAAHRGGSLLWPENSLLAFRNAVTLGSDYLEADVHLSSDGEVVVIHDPTLERTTTGRGPVRASSRAELGELSLKDLSGAVTAERLPLLADVAALAAAARRRLLVEIKVDAQGQRYPEIEERVLVVLENQGVAFDAVVMAFEPETWRRVRALRPDITAGALFSRGTLRATGATPDRALEDAARAGVGMVGFHHALIDQGLVASARRAGIALAAWTVNDSDALRRVIELGVGIVITDRPDLARPLLAR